MDARYRKREREREGESEREREREREKEREWEGGTGERGRRWREGHTLAHVEAGNTCASLAAVSVASMDIGYASFHCPPQHQRAGCVVHGLSGFEAAVARYFFRGFSFRAV